MTDSPWWFGIAPDPRTPDQLAKAAAKAMREAEKRSEQRRKDEEANRKRFATSRDIISAAVEDARAGDTGAVTTGWDTLDRGLGRPIRPGEVVIIGARTGVGKTWIAQHLIQRKLVTDNATRALFGNLEMSNAQMGVRVASHAMSISPREFDQQAWDGLVDVDALVDDNAHLERVLWHEEPAAVDDLPDMHTQASERLGAPVGIIVVDYIGLMAWKGYHGASIYDRASTTARGLKEAAKRTNSIILAAAQLSRAGGKDGTAEPNLDSLRDSGATEEAADRVLMFWRAESDDEEPRLGDGVQIRGKIAKNRHGAVGFRTLLQYDHALRLREVSDAELYAIDNDRMTPEAREITPMVDTDPDLPY